MRDVEVGNSVRVARVTAELTQQDLADAVGVTRQTIGLIEADRYNPTIKICLLIAHTTGRSLDDLFWIERIDDDENTV